jgi:catechol 2,3-dioxygenase-like lactoylglutathione lyase family enzyme
MRQTISFVTLGVADLERSRRFYRALGWRESSASQPAVAFFQATQLARSVCPMKPFSAGTIPFGLAFSRRTVLPPTTCSSYGCL